MRRRGTLRRRNRIEIDPKMMLGKPVIRGTRIPVEDDLVHDHQILVPECRMSFGRGIVRPISPHQDPAVQFAAFAGVLGVVDAAEDVIEVQIIGYVEAEGRTGGFLFDRGQAPHPGPTDPPVGQI